MNEWREQWLMFHDDEKFLFEDWIRPATLNDFRGKTVLECGCGGGQHTAFVASVAKAVTAVDLNTTEIAMERNRNYRNVEFVEADISNMDLGKQYDVVICIGVIHHTDDPDATFLNIYKHCKPGGLMVVWTYSAKGNELVRYFIEPFRKVFLSKLPRRYVALIAKIITLSLYPFVYTIYRSKAFEFLPYYDYFTNFRFLSFNRNVLNVFDKLNAPQTKFTTDETCRRWLSAEHFLSESISIQRYAGVSYSLVGEKTQN